MAYDNLWNPDDQWDLGPNGEYVQQPPMVQPAAPSGLNPDDVRRQLEAVSRGVAVTDADVSDAIARAQGYTGYDINRSIGDFADQYARRAQSGQTGSGVDSTILSGGNGTIQTANPQQATAQYSSAAGAGDAQLQQLLQMLQGQQSGQAQHQAALRDILMGQLGQLGQSPTVNDPGIAENLAGRRLALQRSAERQRSASAEQLAGQGLSQSGAQQTNRLGIEQARGEAEARGIGDVLGAELSQRRDHLSRLLTVAMQLGDAEAARNIQTQLDAIQTQMQQSNFYDTQAFNYAGLNANNNLQTLLALLNAA